MGRVLFRYFVEKLNIFLGKFAGQLIISKCEVIRLNQTHLLYQLTNMKLV